MLDDINISFYDVASASWHLSDLKILLATLNSCTATAENAGTSNTA